MGWEMIPQECALRFMVCMFVVLLLGGFIGWMLTKALIKPEWEIRHEVLREQKLERLERRRRQKLLWQEEESC